MLIKVSPLFMFKTYYNFKWCVGEGRHNGWRVNSRNGRALISQIGVVGSRVNSDSFDPKYHQPVLLNYNVVHRSDAMHVSSR